MMTSKDWRVVHVTGGGESNGRYCIERYGPTLCWFRYRWKRCGITADGHRVGDLTFTSEAYALTEMRRMRWAAMPETVTVMGAKDGE